MLTKKDTIPRQAEVSTLSLPRLVIAHASPAGTRKINPRFIDDEGASSLPALEGGWGLGCRAGLLFAHILVPIRLSRRRLRKINLSRPASAR
jgi:hypothetical protein